MICVRCGHDSNYPDRKDRICPGCKEEFAFEPRAGDPFSDKAFESAINRVSSDGRVRWGVEHLYYELARVKRFRPQATVVFLVILAVMAAVIGTIAAPLGGVLLGGALLLIALLVAFSGKEARLDRAKFETLWQRWRKVHGDPKGVISRRPQAAGQGRAVEPDVEQYSFDRAVICDRARTVDLLLANNFHFENNCAVLSVGGYPQRAFAMVRRMLKKNPRLIVFALHDATPAGCALAQQLATDPEWFAGQGRVVDVGLRPAHAQAFKGLWLRTSSAALVRHDGVGESEQRWLSRWSLELAAVRPEQVIKRLFRAISAYPEGAPSSGGSGGAEGAEVMLFTSDASASDGGGDSFG